MLNPTILTLPDQIVLCATDRGTLNNDMSAAAQRAFGKLFAAGQALGMKPRMTGSVAIYPDEPKGPDDPEVRLIAGWLFSGEHPDIRSQPDLHFETIPAGRWAVFRHTGPYDTLWQTWRSIYGDWVPRARHVLRHTPPFERYLNDPALVPPEQLITDIYVPLD